MPSAEAALWVSQPFARFACQHGLLGPIIPIINPINGLFFGGLLGIIAQADVDGIEVKCSL